MNTSLVYWPLCLIFFTFCLSLHNSHVLNHHLRTKGQIPQEKPFFSSLPLHYNLVIACIQKGQTKEGLKYLNEIENIAPQFLDLPYLKARIYYEERDLQKAVEQLHLMLKINPWHLYSISALADIYLRSGQTKKAAMLKNWRKKQEWRRLSGLAYSSP